MDLINKKADSLLGMAGIKMNGNKPWDIKVNNPKFFARVLSQGSLGAGESYMDGWWDCEKLDEFFNRILRVHLEKKLVTAGLIMAVAKSELLNMQTVTRSKKVAKQHYDLGNEFYKTMLDKHMQYTCGYWKNARTLQQAQEHKLELICMKLGLKKGDTVLELGCGWGGFAKYAAENYGCAVTAYNISKEQVSYARDACKGLPVKIVLDDYRNAKGKYDKVVSIGLCEHVGPKNYRGFMNLAYNCLNDYGLFFLHTIGGNESKVSCDPWTCKYIFPNGVIPSLHQISEASEGLFVQEDFHNFGIDYDKTLMAWFRNFDRSWPKFKSQYGDRFYRMWKYYLLSCAGAFRARKIHLWQFVFSKKGLPGGYNPIT